jgi:uncharacterized protein (TIGR03437 family)
MTSRLTIAVLAVAGFLPLQATAQTLSITAVSPNRATAGSAATPVSITGQNTAAASNVSWTTPDGRVVTIPPSLVSAAQLAATIPATLLSTAGTAQVALVDGSGVLSNQLPFTIAPPVAVATTVPNAALGTPYSVTLSASGGTPPYTWSLAGGSLPPGIGLASTGIISGTPTKIGSFSLTVQAADSTGGSALGSLSINVAAPPVTITTPSPLPSGMASVDYPLQVLSASGGVGPYTFTVPANSLPSGLALSSSGTISGTPVVTGTFPFTLTATDSTGTQSGSKPLQITVRPFSADLLASTGSLSFALAAGATALPGSQTVQVQSTDVTKTLSWSTAITPAATWLSVSSGGTTPGSFSVALTAAASSLAASATPYQTTITVACVAPSPCSGSSQSVTVSLLVSTVPPVLTPLTNLLSFTTSAANPQTTTLSLGVQNTGGGSITFSSVSCPQTWCVAGSAPASLGAGATGTISIAANPTGLSPGYYYTNVTIVSSAGTTTVPVTFFIASNASLTLNPSGTQLSMTLQSVVAVPNTSFLVSVSGTAPVAWSATVLPGAPWLNLVTTSGSSTAASPGVVTYSINQAAAAAIILPGAYYATIRVTSTGVVNSPQDFQIVLNVTPATVKQQPNPTPAGLIFVTSLNGTPAAQTDLVYASSATPIAYQASASTTDGAGWLSVSPATGTTSASSPAPSKVAISTTGLAAGVYYGTVSYSLSAAAVRAVNVTLVVQAAGQAGVAAAGSLSPDRVSSPTQTGSSCTATQIVPTQTGLVSNFASPASWPTPISVQLNNNCGAAVANGQVVATFSNGDPPLALSLVNSASGLYFGTWTPRSSGPQVTITTTAIVPGFPTATSRIAGSVVPNAAPVLALNGTLHIFTPQAGAPLAPGTIVQIYGSNLANQVVFGSAPLQTTLAGTSVIVGGLQAPLFYVGSGQIDAQIPFELTGGQQYQLIVNNNGALSTPQLLQTVAVTPGLAVLPNGYVIAQHQDSSYVTDASPAKPNEYIVLYLAGMGPTSIPVATGAAAPSNPLALTVDAPTITLNGQPVPVATQQYFFSGLAPGFTGLYQIDMQIPSGTPNGDLPLIVSQPGFQGSSVILPVHN